MFSEVGFLWQSIFALDRVCSSGCLPIDRGEASSSS